MRDWHRLSIEEILKKFKTDAATGLSNDEAADRLTLHGPNELIERDRKNPLLMLLEQFSSTLVIILIIAALISGFLGKPTETMAILSIVVLFAVLGFIQEYRAEKAMTALKKLTVPIVRVHRNGKLIEISARDLVPGDVLTLEAGSLVPADVRIIESVNLRIQESALTGESEPVEKEIETVDSLDIPLGDRRNMGYMGTMVTYGKGVAVVVETGMHTELGRIATLIQEVKSEMTPLQRRLEQVGRIIAIFGIAVGLLVMIIGILYGESISDMFLTAVSVAVAVVPEGLPAVVTVTLALGAQRMFKRNSLIRKLPAVETLGSVTVICSDKTGTLTENRMTVTFIDVAGHFINLSEAFRHPAPALASSECHPEIIANQPMSVCMVLMGGALCNDATLQPNSVTGHYDTVGDPTEGALLVAASNVGLSKNRLDQLLPRIAEQPFDSTRKRMTTVHQIPVDRDQLPLYLQTLRSAPAPYIAFTKGAVDALFEISSQIWVDDHIEPLNETWQNRIQLAHDEMAQKGIRVLGVGVEWLKSPPINNQWEKMERQLIFVGLIGMIDPPRPEVKLAVKTCKEAGIRPVMITGDHPLTARFIAHELGIANNNKIISGKELNLMTTEELEAVVEDVSIYARVSPEHKLKIVQALQKKGHVVAMTGDGVNDSPALKKADIGIAMGITGTDVCKESADMVLRDDNFSTIVSAVEEGRSIYDNIRRFVKFSLAGNIGKVLVMLLSPLYGVHVALLPLQLLWLNLLTDGLLGLGLGLEPAEKNVMKRPPRSPKANFFAGGFGWHVLWVGALIGLIACLVGFFYYDPDNPDDRSWQTMLFTVLAFQQIGQALASRAISRSAFNLNYRVNPVMLLMIVATFGLQLAAIYSPFLKDFFNITPLSFVDLILCCILGGVVYVVVKTERLLNPSKAV